MRTALRKLAQADFIFSKTYPAVKDPKLLLAVIENIYQSMDANVQEIFHAKNISCEDSPQARLKMFAQMPGTPKNIVQAMQEMQAILENHTKSPVEFRRKEQFIICSQEYTLDTLDASRVKKYINMARELQVHT